MGYSVELFDRTDLPAEYRCPVCLEVLENVVMTNPCEHTFCLACIQQSLQTRNECPLDRCIVSSIKIPQRVFVNLLHALEMRCPHDSKGCQEKFALGNVTHHLSRCKFNPDNFQTCNMGCEATLFIPEIKNHKCAETLKAQIQALKATLVLEEFKVHKLVSRTRRLEIELGTKRAGVDDLRLLLQQYTSEIQRLNKLVEERRSSGNLDGAEPTYNGLPPASAYTGTDTTWKGPCCNTTGPLGGTQGRQHLSNLERKNRPQPLSAKVQVKKRINISEPECKMFVRIFVEEVSENFNNKDEDIWNSLITRPVLRNEMEVAISCHVRAKFGIGWRCSLLSEEFTPFSTEACTSATRFLQLELDGLTFGIWRCMGSPQLI